MRHAVGVKDGQEGDGPGGGRGMREEGTSLRNVVPFSEAGIYLTPKKNCCKEKCYEERKKERRKERKKKKSDTCTAHCGRRPPSPLRFNNNNNSSNKIFIKHEALTQLYRKKQQQPNIM